MKAISAAILSGRKVPYNLVICGGGGPQMYVNEVQIVTDLLKKDCHSCTWKRGNTTNKIPHSLQFIRVRNDLIAVFNDRSLLRFRTSA